MKPKPGLRDKPGLRTVTTILTDGLYTRFLDACRAEDRSMSAQLRRLVEQWLDERKAA